MAHHLEAWQDESDTEFVFHQERLSPTPSANYRIPNTPSASPVPRPETSEGQLDDHDAQFRLRLSQMREDLDASDDEGIGQPSARSPSESPAWWSMAGEVDDQRGSWLGVAADLLDISSRSSLGLRISFTPDAQVDQEAHVQAGEVLRDPFEIPPWLLFLDEEVEYTAQGGVYYTHRMLVIL